MSSHKPDYEELERRVRELEKQLNDFEIRRRQETAGREQAEKLLYIERDLSIALSAISSMKEAFGIILDAVHEATRLTIRAIYIIDKNTGAAVMEAHKGLSAEFEEEVSIIPPDSPVYTTYFGEKSVCRDLQDTSIPRRFSGFKDGIRTVLVTPVRHRGEVVAYINAASAKVEEIPAAALAAMESIASQVGATLERIRMQESLEFERRQLLSIIDGLGEIAYVADPGTYEILHINKHLFEMIGEISAGDKCYRKFQGLDAPCEFCTNDIILKNPESTFQWEHHNPADNRDYVLFDRIISWPDGRDVRFEIAIDVTDKKRAEEEQRKSEQRFKKLVELAPRPISVIDENGNHEYINPSFTETFGYTLEDFRAGGNWLKLMFPDPDYRRDTRDAWESDREKLVNYEPVSRVFTVRRKNGEDRTVKFFPVLMDNNKFFISYEDITERMKREAELRFQSELLNQIQDLVLSTDLDGIITYVNDATVRAHGMDRNYMIGKSVEILSGPGGDKEREWEILRNLKEHGEYQHQRMYHSLDGREVLLDAIVRLVRDSNGVPIGTLAMARDITEKKKLEEDLRESHEQLRELSRNLIRAQELERECLARDLHDNMGRHLTILSLKTGELLKKREDEKERVFSLLEIIEEMTVEMRGICKGLRPMQLDSLGLEAALESLLDDFRNRAGLEIESSLRLDEGAGPDNEVAISIYRIVQEAMTNVVKHSGAKKAAVSLRTEGDNLVVEIADEGRGFSAGRQETGRGMGLAGIRERAALSGGTVEIESMPGRGTRITIQAPLMVCEKERDK